MNDMRLPRSRCESGSMIITAAVVAAVIIILISGMLTYISNEFRLNIRSHKWTQALCLAESGVDMAFAEFNNFYVTGSNAFTSARGWSNQGGGSYLRYLPTYTNGFGENIGLVYSYVNGVGSANPYLFAYGGTTITTNSGWIYRAIECRLANSARFPAAMVAKGGIDMKGNNVTTDSYDSTDTTKSTNSKYDAAKKQPNGDIATNDAITNSTISVQNANIYGVALTGPSGSVSLGSNGSIGPSFSSPATTIAAAQAAGWVRNDFAVSIPDVTLPTGATSWSNLGSLGNQTVGSGGTASYRATGISLSGNNTLTINGNITLYLQGSSGIDIKGNGSIVVTAGSTLTIYTEGNVSVGGNGVVNSSTSDLNVQLYGMNTCTSFDLHGNGDWSGTVYAPYADFGMGGGGSSGQFSGSVVAKSIGMNGHVTFHYDEALRKSGPNASYNIASWKSYRWNAGTGWVADN